LIANALQLAEDVLDEDVLDSEEEAAAGRVRA
jgi:hypothetical protein